MPELPEVETIRRQLEPVVTGRRIESLEVLDELFPAPATPGELEQAATGRRIARLERRGKYLIFAFEEGGALVVHLRMTGNLVIAANGVQPPYLKAVIALEEGETLHFTDQRRFGRGVVLGAEDLEPYFAARLGVEPLSSDFNPEVLLEAAAGRRAPLKSFLLTQDRVAGIGNIYADEALHRAELHPLSPAGSMRPEHAQRLYEGIVGALEAGLASGGASIDDYLDARGEAGAMQDEFLVHTREGQPCFRCGGTIRRIVVGGRSTYFCPDCQVRLRRRRSRR
jgi:formamidopyrimidine-DNA glycosylase